MFSQSAVVPWRRVNGATEILLIISRTTGQWSIPKGWIEDDMTPQASAAKEAFEEAGVHGKVGDEPLGSYEYSKHGQTMTVQVFPMEVIMICDVWPEKDQRRRRWVAFDEAASFVKDPSLLRIVESLSRALPV